MEGVPVPGRGLSFGPRTRLINILLFLVADPPWGGNEVFLKMYMRLRAGIIKKNLLTNSWDWGRLKKEFDKTDVILYKVIEVKNKSKRK